MSKIPEYACGTKCSTCAHWQGHGWLAFLKQILFVWRAGLWVGWCPIKGRNMWWPQDCGHWEQRKAER